MASGTYLVDHGLDFCCALSEYCVGQRERDVVSAVLSYIRRLSRSTMPSVSVPGLEVLVCSCRGSLGGYCTKVPTASGKAPYPTVRIGECER